MCKIILILCLFFCFCGCEIDEKYGDDDDIDNNIDYYIVGNKYVDSGHANMKKNNFKNAIDDFTEAIKELPDNPYAYGFRGLAKYKDGKDMIDALKDLNKAIKLKNDVSNFYMWRAEIYRSLNKNEAMEADFKKANELRGI